MKNKRATRSILLVALFIFGKDEPCHAKAISRTSLEISTQFWMDAFDFFQSEGDSTSLESLRTKALEKQFRNIQIIKKVLDSLILLKDRSLLNETVLMLAQKNDCLKEPGAAATATCSDLRALWIGNLDSLFFYEESAGKIEHARRFLVSKECDKALSLLKEVELKEGSIVGQAHYSHLAYECLGDDGNRVAKEAELKKLKIFDNY